MELLARCTELEAAADCGRAGFDLLRKLVLLAP